MAVTIDDVWKHVSNKIANKVNDVWEDLNPMIIPVDNDGNFLAPIDSESRPEYGGDTYSLIRALCWNTELLPSATFVYVCPARIRRLDAPMAEASQRSPEELRRMVESAPASSALLISLVHPIEYVEGRDTWRPRVDNGVWWLERNEFEYMPNTNEDDDEGQLPIALGALALKWAIDNGKMGDFGNQLKRSMELAEEARKLAQQAFTDAGLIDPERG